MTDALIAALERLTGPDRAIDEAIFEAVHDRKRSISAFEQYDPSERLPAYTASIDAAMGLVPSEHVLHLNGNLQSAFCFLQEKDTPNQFIAPGAFDLDERKPMALCICIAALKAIAAQKGGG